MPDQSAANDQPQGSIYSRILAHLRPDGPGLEYEGRLRDHVFTNGAWRDSRLYSILSKQ